MGITPLHRRAPLAALLLATCACAAGCSSGNPVEPPAPVPPSGPSSPISVTLASSLGSVEAGSSVGTTITISGRPAPADGTQVKLNTSLGNFGVSPTGAPVQLVTLKLVAGSASTTFYGGSQIGTAVILAQIGTSSGMLNLPVVQPAAKPEAGFTFAVGGFSVLFTDTSKGDPTDFSWSFGDGTGSHLENPSHTYAGARSYEVKLTVLAPGGRSTARQFVTLNPLPGVTAAFSAAVNGLAVLFTDQSTGSPNSWLWSFGDGAVSSQQSPSHTYAKTGTFAVSLSVANASGVSDTTSQFVNVGVTGQPPQAAFAFQGSGLAVTFADRSSGGPTRWSWNFGDGAVSTLQNPAHTYAAAGTYNVTLTAANAAGQSAASQFVTVPLGAAPQANFTFQASGLTVSFADTSTGGPTSWSWNFGDCPATPTAACVSSQQNPTHTYAAAGTYTVTLTAANAAGQSSKNQLVTVAATPPPQAAFAFQASGLTVVFTDQSTGAPTSWSWNFGDCPSVPNASCVSSQQNPTHVYAAAGTYTVTLTAANAAGMNSVSKLVTVAPSQPPQARFCYQRNLLIVSFRDVSTNAPTSWQWDFGDCIAQPAECKSSAQNPAHTYATASNYGVTLLVANANGQSSVNLVIAVGAAVDPVPICP